MQLVMILGLAVGLSMDAFAVSICKGLVMKKPRIKQCLIVGLWFGVFQMAMPLIGYLLGELLNDSITRWGKLISCILLALIGINMLRESAEDEEEDADASVSVKKMFPLAVATSIDALAAGFTIAMMGMNVILSTAIIGATTFILSFIGVKAGAFLGSKWQHGAEKLGGVVLILLGIKVLLEFLGVL